MTVTKELPKQTSKTQKIDKKMQINLNSLQCIVMFLVIFMAAESTGMMPKIFSPQQMDGEDRR